MPVKVIARRTGAGGSVPVNIAARRMGLVGASRGKNTLVSNESVTAGGTSGTTGSQYIDALANNDVRSVVRVANSTGNTQEVYTEGIDFTLNSSGDVDWTSAGNILPPTVDTPTVSAGAGTWAVTGTFGFKITATDQEGTGETTPSDAVTAAVSASGDVVALTWAKVPFAGGYKIYLATGSTYELLVTIADGDTTSYSATGGTTTATSPPSSNTAKRRPGAASAYYITYYYAVFTYTKSLYTNFGDILDDHGVGSDITNAARYAFKDNGATEAYVVAPSGTTSAHYQTALDTLATVRVSFISVLKGGTAIEQYLRAHCEKYSGDNYGMERNGVVAVTSGAVLGDVSTAGSILYWLNSMQGSKRMIGLVPNKSVYYANLKQGTDGNFVEGPVAVDAHFYAAAVAGALCSRPDPATPLTNAVINGFTWAATVELWVDVEYQDIIEAAGGTYVKEESGTHVIYHGITCNTTSVEDQEISVVDAEDEMRYQLRTAMSTFRGRDRKITLNRLQAIANRTQQVLATLVKEGIIESYGDIEVTQDASNPTKIWVRFNYAPIYPMNIIEFNYGFSVAPLSAAA